MLGVNARRLRRMDSRLVIDHIEESEKPSPISGYAQEPLLSLADACESLMNIVDNIMTYVMVALKDTAHFPTDGLTRDESASIRLYTMEWDEGQLSLYCILNKTLKDADRSNLQPWLRYLKLLLTGLAKLPCESPQTIWRGVRDLNGELTPKTQMTWWAFSSCTKTLSVLENDVYLGTVGERTLFSIEALNGRNIRGHSHFGDEDEILLLPGTRVEVLSRIKPADNLCIIHLKQKSPNKMQLEPPFEGIWKFFNTLFELNIFLLGARLFPDLA